MDSTRREHANPAPPDDDGGPTHPAGSGTERRFRRGTVLKALGAALIGGALGGRSLNRVSSAKRRNHRRKHRTPAPRPRPRPAVPPTIWTQTFTNRDEIRFRAVGPADPYPSSILVSGLAKARILDVNLTLHELRHDRPSDVAVMLVSPSGKGAVVMHNAGGDRPATGAVLVFDDQAAESMPHEPDARLASGTYQPTSIGSSIRAFPSPAPQTVNNTALSTFNDDNPNGEWRLYVVDDSPLNDGLIVTGWSLALIYELPAKPTRKRRRPKPPKQRRGRKHRKVRR